MAQQRDRTERRAEERAVEKQENRDLSNSPDIPERLRPILTSLPPEQRQTLFAYMEHRGPLPPPFMLEQYKEIDPELPALFVRWYQEQQAHRHSIESYAIPKQVDQSARGQWLAFGSAILFMATTVVCALTGHDGVAMVTGGVTAVNTVAAFLSSRQKD